MKLNYAEIGINAYYLSGFVCDRKSKAHKHIYKHIEIKNNNKLKAKS
jgi:hypothetical protein